MKAKRELRKGPAVHYRLTGNAGLYHVARELSRRGWHAMPTVRNARGSDLYAVNADESVILRVQSKALSKRTPVPLGSDLNALRSEWWVITVRAHADRPTCYVMTLSEVKAGAHRGENAAGKVSYWLQPKAYAPPAYEEKWERLGEIGSAVAGSLE